MECISWLEASILFKKSPAWYCIDSPQYTHRGATTTLRLFIMEEYKKKEYNPLEGTTVFKATHDHIVKSAVRQCQNHTWRKLNDTEVACTVCPTVNIVNNSDDYLSS